jgi:hypothetical protein
MKPESEDHLLKLWIVWIVEVVLTVLSVEQVVLSKDRFLCIKANMASLW